MNKRTYNALRKVAASRFDAVPNYTDWDSIIGRRAANSRPAVTEMWDNMKKSGIPVPADAEKKYEEGVELDN